MVMVGNDSHICIFGVENSYVPNSNLIMKNTLIAPDLPKKYFSFFNLLLTIIVVSCFIRGYFSSRIWGCAKYYLKGLWRMDYTPCISSLPLHLQLILWQIKCQIGHLWHAWLGHANIWVLQPLLQFLYTLNKNVVFCESYILGPSTQLSFHAHNPHVSSFLHTIQMDVWGLAPIISLDGFCFYLVIVDEHSYYIWLFPLARISNVISIFPNFLTLLENKFHTCVKIIQSDGSGEFVNQTIKIILFLKALSINFFVLDLWNKMVLHRGIIATLLIPL